MRQVKVLITYLFIVFGGAAVLAPLLYAGIRSLSDANIDWWKVDQLADYLARHPFHRYVSRCMLLLALVGLSPLLKELKFPGWKDAGLDWPTKRNRRFLAAAFLVGFSTLTLAAAVAIGTGSRTFNFDYTASTVLRHFKNAILAAILVSLVEELLFRGVLFKALRRSGSFFSAALISSAFYAILHFFEKPGNPPQVDYHSGMLVLGQMFSGLFSLDKLVPAFFNLVLVGLILSLAFERTRSLYFSIGMHSAFILWGKSFSFFTKQKPGVSDSAWGSDKMIDGWLPFVLLALLLVFLDRTLPGTAPATQVLPPPLPNEYPPNQPATS